MQEVLKQYGFQEAGYSIQPLGNGLINSTWLVEQAGNRYVLQRINQQVFHFPEDIAFNIRLMADYLNINHPDYLFTSPVQTSSCADFVKTGEGYYRLFVYIDGSYSIDVVEKPEQAYEAARQFGRFTKLLSGLDTGRLKITLPDFHNLPYRYLQFEQAMQHGNKERIRQSETLINLVRCHFNIVEEFEKNKRLLKNRCTHHDTKISNVLLMRLARGFV